MESRKSIAVAKRESGNYNCSQAVAATYADKMGVEEEVAKQMTAAFGIGMGNMEGTCGAVVGAGVVIGMVTKERGEARKCMKQLMEEFGRRNGATQCKLLKGIGTGVVLRDCSDCVADAAELLEQVVLLES